MDFAAHPALAPLARWRLEIERALEAALHADPECPPRLHEAMAYALRGGKRVRALLALLCCAAAGGRRRRALGAAAALECAHAYSLIHDDLPCMDDDDFRRGRPSCHRAFGETLAVLAGDALQALAFRAVLAPRPGGPGAACRAALALELATAIGPGGMVGGQVRDLALDGDPPAEAAARRARIDAQKTGALIVAAARMGARAGGADEPTLAAVTAYGAALGLAFQAADDLLDGEAGGAAGARAEPARWTDAAVTALTPLGDRPALAAFARALAARRA